MNTYNYDEIFKDIESRHGLEVLDLIHNLPLEKQRIAMLAAICYKKDSNLVKIINELKSSSRIAYLDSLIERIRKYNGIGDIEKKSFGEVFTPFSLIEEMLDTLPVEVWTNPNLKWGDFCNGIGNFMVIVIKRLMIGLKEWENDDDLRYKHIVENMIYVGELQEKNMFLWMVSIDPRSEFQLNLYRGDTLSSEFDEHMKNEWGVEKLDIIVGNPPYQKQLIGGNRMKPIYNDFIEKYVKLSNYIILSVHPSRWMASQVELKKFRQNLLANNFIKIIKNFENSQDIFGKNVDIEGGVQYMLIDKNYNGLTEMNNLYVDLNKYDIVPTNLNTISIIDKMVKYNNLSTINLSKMFYGIKTNDIRFKNEKETNNDIVCYVSQQKGFKKFIDKLSIKNNDNIDSYKIITARANGGNKKFGNKFIGYPNEVWCESYIALQAKSENEAKSLLSYMNTVFCNFLLGLRKNTQDIKPDTCKWIPIVPFDREWTDEQLYKHFNLTQEEIDLIESSVK